MSSTSRTATQPGRSVLLVVMFVLTVLLVGFAGNPPQNEGASQAASQDANMEQQQPNEDEVSGPSLELAADTDEVEAAAQEQARRENITADLASMGWNSNEFTFACDPSLDPVERGNSAFSNTVLNSPAEIAAYLNSGSPQAQAQVAQLRQDLNAEDFDRVMRGEGFTCVQFAKSAVYQGNSYYRNGQYHFTTSNYVVNVGDRVWVYTNAQNQVIRAGSVRADCGNGNVQMVVPNPGNLTPVPEEVPPAPPVVTIVHTPPVVVPPVVIPPVVVPPVVTPPVVVPPVVTPPDEEPELVEVCNPENGEIITVPEDEADNYAPVDSPLCEEEEEPQLVQRCDTTTNAIVTITAAEAQDTDRYKDVNAPECKPVVPTLVERCDTTNWTIVTITETEAQNTDRYKAIGADECKPPVVVEDKCPAEAGVQTEFCGTPDEGAEQQPVQDNNPDHVAPTPGYTPGDAEDNAEEQGDPCAGATCGTDPTESGTEIDNSQDGGAAPAPPVVTPIEQPDTVEQPDNAGQPNPDFDGSQPTENPDLGTAAPVDTGAEDQVDNGAGDPFGDVELPNVDG